MLPEVSTETMRVFLDRFSATLPSDTHAMLVIDRAGQHGTGSQWLKYSSMCWPQNGRIANRSRRRGPTFP